MQPSDNLYLLIKSLSRSEKRDFKLFVSRYKKSEQKICVRMFDIIDKLDHYDEKTVKKRLKDPGVVAIFPEMKIYLHNLLIRSLRILSHESTSQMVMLQMLQDDIIYEEKGLPTLREKAITKAKQLARKHEDSHMLLLSLDKHCLLEIESGNEHIEDILEESEKEEMTLLKDLETETQLKYLFYHLWSQYKINPKPTDIRLIEKYQSLKSHSLLTTYVGLPSFRSKWFFLRSHSLLSTFINDKEGARSYYKQIIDLFDEYPNHKQDKFPSYQSSLINYLASSHRLKNYDEFENVISKVHAIGAKTEKDKAGIFADASFYELLYLINTGQLQKALLILPDISLNVEQYKNAIQESRVLSFYNNIAIVYFLSGRYSEAMDYTNKVLDYKSDIRVDIHHNVAVLDLILHYELDNTQFLKYRIRNFAREFRQRNELGEFERLLLKYIKKLSSTISTSTSRALLQDFKTNLEMLSNVNKNYRSAIAEEIIIWINMKLSKPSAEEQNINLTELGKSKKSLA